MNKTQELLQKLQDGVRDVFESGRFQSYLDFLAGFHAYSASNCLLLWQQMPTCSLVASFTDWTQKYHRQIIKGSKSLLVLAPHVYTETDDAGVRHERLGFHAARVFDVSQTYSLNDEPLPTLCQPLDGDVVGSEDIIDTLVSVAPCPVEFQDIDGSPRGYFSPSELRIVVQRGMSPLDTIKTILHECGHAWIFAQGGADVESYDRATHEVAAEGIAYILCQRLSIDSGSYSFGYVSGWSSSQSTPELKKSLDMIRKVSDLMWQRIEERLAQDGTDEGASNNAA